MLCVCLCALSLDVMLLLLVNILDRLGKGKYTETVLGFGGGARVACRNSRVKNTLTFYFARKIAQAVVMDVKRNFCV